jgi:hypothetical protein
MVFDPAQTPPGVIMVEGNGTSGILSDTWEFTVSVGWVQLMVSGPTPARYDAGIAFDASQNSVFLVGGVAKAGSALSDDWEFVSGGWTSAHTSFPGGGRWGMGFVFDPSAGLDGFGLLFGGSNGTAVHRSSVVVGGTATGQGDSWQFLGTPPAIGEITWFDIELLG